MKIHAVIAELSHADGQPESHMDRHEEANSCYLQFCELPGVQVDNMTTQGIQLISHLMLILWPGNYKYAFSVFETCRNMTL
jgi:hypothetical protein